MPDDKNSNIDDLLRQMQEDELEDRLATQTVATPTAYAKLKGLYPQRVYAAIRSRKLQTYECSCGRKLIDIAAADQLFGIKRRDDDDQQEEL